MFFCFHGLFVLVCLLVLFGIRFWFGFIVLKNGGIIAEPAVERPFQGGVCGVHRVHFLCFFCVWFFFYWCQMALVVGLGLTVSVAQSDTITQGGSGSFVKVITQRYKPLFAAAIVRVLEPGGVCPGTTFQVTPLSVLNSHK